MKQLPKYFAVKVGNNELSKKYIEWLNKKYNIGWNRVANRYFGYDGNTEYASGSGTSYWENIRFFDNNPVELTLQEWDEIVNGKKLTLQDEFIIDMRGEKLSENIIKNSQDVNYNLNWNFVKWLVTGCSLQNDDIEIVKKENPDVQIITYKQFLEMQEKKIIGYKLVKEEYLQAACVITRLNKKTLENLNILVSSINNTFTLDLLKEANVLDLWFEPIYKTEEKILQLGSPKKIIKVTKEGFTVEDKLVKESVIQQVITEMQITDRSIYDWMIIYPSVKIGCSIFTKEELELLIKTQKEL